MEVKGLLRGQLLDTFGKDPSSFRNPSLSKHRRFGNRSTGASNLFSRARTCCPKGERKTVSLRIAERAFKARCIRTIDLISSSNFSMKPGENTLFPSFVAALSGASPGSADSWHSSTPAKSSRTKQSVDQGSLHAKKCLVASSATKSSYSKGTPIGTAR